MVTIGINDVRFSEAPPVSGKPSVQYGIVRSIQVAPQDQTVSSFSVSSGYGKHVFYLPSGRTSQADEKIEGFRQVNGYITSDTVAHS